MDTLTDAGVDTFLSWLNAELGTAFISTSAGAPTLAVDGDRRLAITVRPLFDVESDPAWNRRREAVATSLREAESGPLTLWVPPETDLPHGDRTDFIRHVVDAARDLARGQRGQVEFPVRLTLKKLSDEASYVHISGALAPYWARLTGRAFGQYELDATQIHRLPEPETRVAELLDWVVLQGNGMKARTSMEIDAVDAWTLSRPAVGDWTGVLGAPPDTDPTNGTAVRRSLRQGLRSAEPELVTAWAGAKGEVARAVVFVGIFRTMEEETATIALRGCDPTLYSRLDAVCLVADGHCKVLHGPRRDRFGAVQQPAPS